MTTLPTRFSAACMLLMSLFGASISASSWFWIQPQTKFDADFILHTTHPPSESHCAGDCLAYSGCRAAYYCGNTKTCALTDSSCSSVQGGFLLSDQNCNYLQTRNRTESYLECRCQNGGTWINSTEASDSQNKCVCPVPYGGPYCDRNLTCPPQYEALFRSSCYSFNTTLTGTFDEAKAHCETMGARLVAVNDAEEHSFISQYIAADAARAACSWWTAATDAASEGHWTLSGWGDIPAPFTAWSGGQPDNNGGNQDCSRYWAGGTLWDDTACTAVFNFICEGDAI